MNAVAKTIFKEKLLLPHNYFAKKPLSHADLNWAANNNYHRTTPSMKKEIYY